MTNMQVAFVNTEQKPVKRRHICYYTTSVGDEISLHRVCEEFYLHPDAPDDALITITTTRHLKTLKRNEFRAGPLLSLEAQQNTTMLAEPEIIG